MPAPRSALRDMRLSMLTAADTTSQPQYGSAASSNKPLQRAVLAVGPVHERHRNVESGCGASTTAEQTAARIDLDELSPSGSGPAAS